MSRQNLDGALKRIPIANRKPSKYELYNTKISSLGHIVSASGVATDAKKIKLVIE